jgi:hypothetical protein
MNLRLFMKLFLLSIDIIDSQFTAATILLRMNRIDLYLMDFVRAVTF